MVSTSMAVEVERVLRTIFKRCVTCDTDHPPCPDCGPTQVCSLVPYTCTACAQSVCVENPNPQPQTPAGPNVAAIAGGVVGGVAFVGIIVFLVWFLWIRKKRAQQDAEIEEWEGDDIAQQKAAFHSMIHDSASTRTRGSFAGSMLSRASNVIQIAFIPGVTTRTASSRNSMLTSTPVPPVPAARGTPRSPLSNQDDAIFFRPGDIRDSSYSGTSSIMLDRRDTQYTVNSQDSSSVYHESLTIQPLPATQRAMPRMVSVKSATTNSSGGSPTIDSGNVKPVQIVMPGQGSGPNTSGSVRSQGSYGKPTQITVGTKGKGRFPVKTVVDAASAAKASARHVPDVSSPLRDANNDTDEDDEDFERGKKSLLKTTPPAAAMEKDSPFFDPSEAMPTQPNPYASLASTVNSTSSRGKSMGGLSAVIEEATRKASSSPSHDGLGGTRDASPFDDSHRVN